VFAVNVVVVIAVVEIEKRSWLELPTKRNRECISSN